MQIWSRGVRKTERTNPWNSTVWNWRGGGGSDCDQCQHDSSRQRSLAGWYLRLIDSCITQLKAQKHSRTCNESKEEEKKTDETVSGIAIASSSLLLSSLELSDTKVYEP